MNLADLPEYLTAADLTVYDLTSEDVRHRCPHAVEYTGLDGSPCWCRDDLEPLVTGGRMEDRR